MEAAENIFTTGDEQSPETARIIAVDDDRTMRFMLQAQLEDLGHDTQMVENGSDALEILRRDKSAWDVMLLDREMPGMNGLEVVEQMKNDPILKNIPIIMQTGSDKPDQIKEGIDAGVFYYLTKPIDEDILKSVLSSAIRESRKKKILSSELQQHKTSFNLIETCTFKYRTLLEAESLACFIANCYPDPQRVVSGLAELLINAVEHGNLGIGYSEKTWLVQAGTWYEEMTRRVDLPEHRQKFVEVSLKNKSQGIYVKISDQGKGFDWRRFLEVDPSRALDNHGRGIAQALAISFDDVSYNEKGNTVTTFVSSEPELDW